MGRISLVAMVMLCACKRTHDAPKYESDNMRVAAEPAVAARADDLAVAALPGEPAPPRPAGVRMPDGGTINGDPRGPRAAEFNRVINDALARMPACFAGAEVAVGDTAIKVHYVVEPPG